MSAAGSGARVIPLPTAPTAAAGPPLAGGVLPRERLFERLDAAVGAATWIVAPAGYGKSSLAASYVRTRALPCVWLRAGALDAEPASFFAHLSSAAGARLPVPQSEQLPGLRGFARTYFQALFAAAPASAALVIDEAETAAEPLQEMLAEAVAAVPEGARLVVTSRTAPPPALAKARIEGRLQVIEAEALAMTREEIAALFAQRRREAGADELDAVHRQTLGWPAAVALTLNAGGRLPTVDDAVLRDYLAHEVWPAFDAQTQRWLVLAAHLPYVNAVLEQHWAPLAGAGAMLARYAERGLFVLTDRGNEASQAPRHVLHPLIRGFLLRHAEESLPADERAALRRDAAQALAAAGDAEAAVPMLLEAGEASRALPLVLGLAPRLLAQARLKTLAGWLSAMPAAQREAQPYVDYWLGLVRLMSSPGRAREHLLRAAEAFRARGDAAGRLRTLAHLAYLSFVDFAPDYPITRWLGDLQEVAPRFDELASAEEKAQVAMTVVYALLVGEPSHPDLPLWRDRAMQALHTPISLPLRARLASVAGINLLWSGLFDQLAAMHALVARDIARQGLSDYGQLVFGLVELDACWAEGRLADAPAVLERLLATADQCGIHTLDTFHRLLANDALLAAGALEPARTLLAEARAKMLPTQLTEVWHAAFQSAWLAAWRGDGATAATEARAAIDAARTIRSPMCEAFGWIALALAHRLRGSDADVRDTLATLEALAPRSGSDMVAFHVHDLQAWLARRAGDADAEARALALALPCLARHGVIHPALGTAAALGETAAAALAHGIEPAFVRLLIERRALPAPALDAPPDWPHPVRLRLLGGFELHIDGELLVFDGKVQKRPLELLQAIAVRGTSPVPLAALIDDLWPEQEGDAARKSFDAALHRLRKLLGAHGSVLRVEAGAVQVDTARVGCDLWVLQRLADESPSAAPAPLGRWAVERAGQPLLPGQDAAWAAAARERHAARMRRRFGVAPGHP